jgi:hypothetical protein
MLQARHCTAGCCAAVAVTSIKGINLTHGLTKYHTKKTFGGVEVLLQAFLTSTLGGGEWQLHARSILTSITIR